MRVYELSKLMGISNKELLKILKEMGYDISSHVAAIPSQAVDKIQEEAKKLLSTDKLVEKPSSQKKAKTSLAKSEKEVIEPKDKAIKKFESVKDIEKSEIEKEKIKLTFPEIEKQAVISKIIKKDIEEIKVPKKEGEKKEIKLELMPATAFDLASKLNKPISEIILTLLKQGIIATKNQLLNVTTIKKIADFYGVQTIEPVTQKKSEITQPVIKESLQEGILKERMPIVVVIGHVDHGKTTLLDFIRKTRVAIKEKGGITQHLGAYEVDTPQGSIIFLDTPGHEAFSMLRSRGVKIADIGVLVVAADDGVMPQTVEAIKLAKLVQLPLIVALNKIDKATEQQIEQAKHQLAKNDLVPEEWGGSTVTIPISAKLGTGIDNLLDILILQSQLLELKANMSVPATGYILESRLEKGRGPVATVILQHGTLKVGDYFFAGEVSGRVSSLVDSFGNQKKEVGPSVPISVAGFEKLPILGDAFHVVSDIEYKRGPKNRRTEKLADIMQKKEAGGEQVVNILVKTDNISSKEAILNLIDKLSKKSPVKLHIVYTGIGDITENDVILASDTKSIIYGLHVKTQPNAYEAIVRYKVPVKTFDIIYKLIENLEATAESYKPIEYVSKKIGEGVVIQVFDIKNIGIIAGVRVKSGRFIKNGKIVVYRNRSKIWEGPIDGLQREKKSVKEVHSGFECAIFVKDFKEWQIDDVVESFQDVPL